MIRLGSRLSCAAMGIGLMAAIQLGSTLPARAQYQGQTNPYNGGCECVTFPCVCNDSAKKGVTHRVHKHTVHKHHKPKPAK